jgi:hypothetical protein
VVRQRTPRHCRIEGCYREESNAIIKDHIMYAFGYFMKYPLNMVR